MGWRWVGVEGMIILSGSIYMREGGWLCREGLGRKGYREKGSGNQIKAGSQVGCSGGGCPVLAPSMQTSALASSSHEGCIDHLQDEHREHRESIKRHNLVLLAQGSITSRSSGQV